MKKIASFFLLLGTLFLVAGCDRDFDDLNVDPKRPSEVEPGALFANASKELADVLTTPNVNIGIFRLLSQQWTQTTYTDESNYDLTTRNIPQNVWNTLYVSVLKNLDEAQSRIPTQDSVFVPEAVQTNQMAAAEILTVYTFATLVTMFGDVPYVTALDIENVNPAYDDAATIFNDLFERLDAALATIVVEEGGFGSSDLICGGDMNCWVRFGNSLKLRMAMTIAEVDPAKAEAEAIEAAPNVIMSNEENIAFNYLGSPPNTNPVWEELVQSNRKDFVAANTIVDLMDSLADPRLRFFFTEDADGGFSGGTYGASNNYATFSKPNDRLTEPTFPALLFDAAEVQFLLAEAAARGFDVPGSAEEHYEQGIRFSMEYWGVPESEIDAYLAQPEVQFSQADWEEKIGLQAWLALYNRGFEAWTSWRRLNFPIFNVPDGLTYEDIPLRFTYPVQEQTLNAANYAAAAAAIGGDLATTRLWWDKS